jgi:hypothetical protein
MSVVRIPLWRTIKVIDQHSEPKCDLSLEHTDLPVHLVLMIHVVGIRQTLHLKSQTKPQLSALLLQRCHRS